MHIYLKCAKYVQMSKPRDSLVYEIQQIFHDYAAAQKEAFALLPGAEQNLGHGNHDVVWVNFTHHTSPSDPHFHHRQHYAVLPGSSNNEVQSLNLGWPVKMPHVLIRLLQSYMAMGLIDSSSDKDQERDARIASFSKLIERGIETRYQKEDW